MNIIRSIGEALDMLLSMFPQINTHWAEPLEIPNIAILCSVTGILLATLGLKRKR